MMIAYCSEIYRSFARNIPGSRLQWLSGASLMSLLILVGCGAQAPEEQATEPPAVGVVEVGKQKVNPFFEFVGRTRAKESVALRARVTGFLESREFEEGGTVEEGQVLFKIEPERYQASLAQAEAELAAAEASLNRAQVDAARYDELLKANNISQQKVDEAQAEVLVQEAAVQTAKAAIKQAQLDVDYTQVKAPIAGRIDVAAFDVGNLVGPDSGVLATINMMEPINVSFSISETWYLELVQADLDAKKAGEDVEEVSHIPLIRLPDGSMYEHPGEFDFFDNKVDEKTGTVLLRALFPNPDQLLLPGQFVTVVVERKEAVDSVMVPQAALLTDQGGNYVLAVDANNKAESRRLTTGQRFGTNVVVKEGLEQGDRVVLYGIQKVRPGMIVNPEITEAPSDPSAGVGQESAMTATEAEARTAAGDEQGSETESGSESGAEPSEKKAE